MRPRAEKPLLGFGWAGMTLLVVLLSLLVPTLAGYDLRYQLQRAIHAAFGWPGTVWFVTRGLFFHFLSLEMPVYSTVSLLYIFPALHLYPYRVRWWWWVGLFALAVVGPALWLQKSLWFWPPPWRQVILSSATTAGAGVLLGAAGRSWRLLVAVCCLALAGGALVCWEESRTLLTAPQYAAVFYSWHAAFAVTLLSWALGHRVRRLPAWCCPGCGYDLRGAGELCPECGAMKPMEGADVGTAV